MSRVSILVYQKGYVGYMLSVACVKKNGMQTDNKNTNLSSFHIQDSPSEAKINTEKGKTQNSFHANSPDLPKIIYISKYKPFTHVLGSPTTQAAQDLELGFKEAQRRPGAPKVDDAKI